MATKAPIYRIASVDIYERPVRLRLPFRFGDTLVEATGEAYLAVTVQGMDGMTTGYAAQLMVPRWFDKRPGLSNGETVDELRDTLKAAASAAIGLSGTVVRLSAAIRKAVRKAMPKDTPLLAAGFGPAVMEMALIDAACRNRNMSFPAAVRGDLFGLVDVCPPDLAPRFLQQHLAGLAPREDIAIRHTVGYDAPLVAADITDPPDDSLPVALADVIAATGISWFKIKLKGDPESDIDRLCRIAEILRDRLPYRVTLDANEQYSQEGFAEFLSGFAGQPALADLRRATLFIEQPFPREIALSADGPLPPPGVPIIIDESDDDDDSFPRAAARGWAGVSVKSCKGVLRALINSARAENLKRQGFSAILTAEDLTCQPGLCWQQDTLMAATVGALHIERNGHHFGGSMQGAPDAEKAAFLKAHADIYAPGPDGPVLRIEAGRVRIASMDVPGFATRLTPDLQHTQSMITEKEQIS